MKVFVVVVVGGILGVSFLRDVIVLEAAANRA